LNTRLSSQAVEADASAGVAGEAGSEEKEANHMYHRFAAITARLVATLALALPVDVALARGPQVLFEQPAMADVTGHAYVVSKPRKGSFFMVLWQRNPHREDGALVPVTWAVGDKTGFYPTNPLERSQLGMRNEYGSTALQIEGYTVGAYLNSADLAGVKHQARYFYKEMVAPAYEFPPAARMAPFDETDSALSCSLELQVPVAKDGGESRRSSAYITLNLLMVKDDGVGSLSLDGWLFNHRRTNEPERLGLDPVTKNVLILTPIHPKSKWSTYTKDSDVWQGEPWTGWKRFRFTMTRDNFISALKAVRKKHPDLSWTGDPSEWKLAQIHLNAEIRYETAPAEMGWSMRKLRCATATMSTRQ
jgi:hypothetical protein